MNRGLLVCLVILAHNAWAQTPVNKLWNELEHRRAGLASVHQEFVVSTSYKVPETAQASKRTIVVDMSQGLWREALISGSGNLIRVFDGEDTLQFDELSNEFIRIKPNKKGVAPVPAPYEFTEVEWKNAKEMERLPCGVSSNDHTCVVLQLPLKRTSRMDPNTHTPNITEGVATVAIDTTTGLLIRSQIQETVQTKNRRYDRQLDYSLSRFSIGTDADVSLIKLPSKDVREVKQFSQWNASRIRKEFSGKAAPDLDISDINGNPLSLGAFKGKTILLDFWTSWCSRCKADGPDLEKLNERYGGKELAIIGISVDEDRATVERFLKKHPKSFPVALTTENEMPRPYQIGAFPTYIVIDQQGNVTTAVQGEKGFSDLRKLLQEAGMDIQ